MIFLPPGGNMTLYFMANEETLKRTPPEVLEYLRYLRRRIAELETTEPQQRIEELEATIRKLQVEIEDLQAIIHQQEQQIHQLQQQLADARVKLGTDSTNSSMPPSSDRFHSKRRPPRPADQPPKKRGGQPGHPQHQRPLVPPEKVRQTIPCKPTTCRRCGEPLTGNDPNPLRHQVAELPVVVPDVVEYQLHRLICPCCHTSTCGTLPPEVKGNFGPRLEATLALLAGQYRMGIRPVVTLASDLWGLDIATGMISKLRQRTSEALLLPYAQVAVYVQDQNVNIDETHWREGKEKVYLWAVLTPLAGLFRIAKGRTAQVAQELLGKQYAGVATCDRLKSYWWIKRLQWCWAHLRRDFQAMIDRGKPGQAIGERLLEQSNRLFHLWHQLREGKLSRTQFQEAMKPVREKVRQVLRAGQKSGCEKTAGTCKELLNHQEWLWTFVEVEGVEPTNNEAERAERHGVLWRKTSGGTDSPQGSRFVERILTVVETCRRQGKDVLDYLRACIEAWRHNRAPPNLVTVTS
jgi:transposase